jgi:hypothetical protein
MPPGCAIAGAAIVTASTATISHIGRPFRQTIRSSYLPE